MGFPGGVRSLPVGTAVFVELVNPSFFLSMDWLAAQPAPSNPRKASVSMRTSTLGYNICVRYQRKRIINGVNDYNLPAIP